MVQATNALLIPVLVALMQWLKTFLPRTLTADQQDSAVRALTVLLGIALEVAFVLLPPAALAVIGTGIGIGAGAIATYHGGKLVVGTIQQAAPTTPAPVQTTLFLTNTPPPALKPEEFPQNVTPPAAV